MTDQTSIYVAQENEHLAEQIVQLQAENDKLRWLLAEAQWKLGNLEEVKYDLSQRQRDCDRVLAALMALYPDEPEKVRAGWLAELAALEITRLREQNTNFHSKENHND